MSETLEQEEGLDVELLKDLVLFMRSHAEPRKLLNVTLLEKTALAVQTPGSGTRMIYGTADLGIMERGSAPYHLIYHPKSIIGDPFDKITLRRDDVPIELVPVFSADRNIPQLRLLVNGVASSESEVTVIYPGGRSEVIETDSNGLTRSLPGRGRFAAWARYWEDTPGVHEGKEYAQIRHYATLVFDSVQNSSDVADSEMDSNQIRVDRWIDLPIATASFGAVASQGWLYLYGGHTAPPHEYHTNSSSGGFWRLDLAGRNQWEVLPGDVSLQGMNLAAATGVIYRIGGMQSLNEKGENVDNRSVADCAAFDPGLMRWNELPPLPVPRSSHDVVAIGQVLYVLGGWNMRPDESSVWHNEVFVLDLALEKPEWEHRPQPFQRRALIAAAMGHRIYVMGGFNESNRPSQRVEIYDTRTRKWSEGPNLPGSAMNGFAPAACVHDGRLILSLGDGSLVMLADDRQSWQQIAETTPRIVHRMVSFGSRVVVAGGAANDEMLSLVEAVFIPSTLPASPEETTTAIHHTSRAYASRGDSHAEPRGPRSSHPGSIRPAGHGAPASHDGRTVKARSTGHPVALGQLTCPIMTSRRIDYDSPVAMYKDRPVALCCETCLAKWEADPDSYAAVANLPQFEGLEAPERSIKQVFCPVYPDRVVSQNDPSVEYRGTTVYLFNRAAQRRWNENPEQFANTQLLRDMQQELGEP
ncbi:MAG: Kelch repeat-containing protein [Phycisphaerae bacterium]